MREATERDLFDEMTDHPESEAPQFEDIPANAWVLVRTAGTDNGNAVPKLDSGETKDNPPRTFYKIRMGLIAIGGDKLLDPKKHANRMVFMDLFLHPGEQELERDATKKLAGRFTGFLNSLFASGVAEGEKDEAVRAAARWNATRDYFKAIRTGAQIDDQDVTMAAYNNDLAWYMAALTVFSLREKPQTLLVKTQAKKGKDDVVRLKISAYEDATPANIAKRRVTPFPEEGDEGISY